MNAYATAGSVSNRQKVTHANKNKANLRNDGVESLELIRVTSAGFTANPSVLSSSGSQHFLDHQVHPLASKNTRHSALSTDQPNSGLVTISKGEQNLIIEQASGFEETQFQSEKPMSHFSASYQKFKRQKQAGAEQRRNIQSKPQKMAKLTHDMYFHGQITTDDEKTTNPSPPVALNKTHETVRQRNRTTVALESATQLQDELNNSLPGCNFSRYQVRESIEPYDAIKSSQKLRNGSQNVHLIGNLKQTYSSASKASRLLAN